MLAAFNNFQSGEQDQERNRWQHNHSVHGNGRRLADLKAARLTGWW
jgi:hypothetical protein